MNKRPTAVIMHDDWYGHRDPFTGDPKGDKDEWLEWDFLLLETLQMIEDHTDDTGLLVWETDDPAAVVDAIPKINKFDRAREVKESAKNFKRRPGTRYVPKLWSRRKDDEGEDRFQTFREWVERSVAEESD